MPGSRSRAVLSSAATLPATGGAVGRHIGGNSPEGETKAEAGAMGGGPGWQSTDAQLRGTDGWAQEPGWGCKAVSLGCEHGGEVTALGSRGSL